jgi:hemoglobin-like flavoprotein
MLTAEKIHRLRRSFARVEQNPVVSALVFYRRLFELDPALRPLFKADIEEQSRKLMELLGWSLSTLNDDGALRETLAGRGARHVDYGVRESHYEVVGQALIEMLEEVLGEHFDAVTREAWLELYGVISEAMIEGARTHSAALHSGHGSGNRPKQR